jgi:ubiquinol-cytochrome c reductase cytochrome c1 subunit
MKKLIAILLASLSLAGAAHAAEGGIPWDKFPEEKMSDMASLQHGAKLFVNYCLNCHSASFMRYNRMRDIGLSETEIKNNLLFAADKVGDTMKVSLDPNDAKAFFGANPPDLTVIARSRAGANGTGADYLYTYMRNFYRDGTKETGWNNLAFPSVAMPHVLWELQGQRAAKFEEVADPHDPAKKIHAFAGYQQLTPGLLSERQYDEAVADLVAYMQWMGEPAQGQRFQLGVIVLIFLGFLTIFAWRLNASYWKDVK